jgi:hypothetical protein
MAAAAKKALVTTAAAPPAAIDSAVIDALCAQLGLPANDLLAKLGDRLWRLDNLYTFEDENGEVHRFRLNDEQRLFLQTAHNRNIILKARQLGFTTLACLLMLDACLFNSNTKCGIIAQTKPDAEKIFTIKIKAVYDRLPDVIRALRPPNTDRAQQLSFANGSYIWVDTSHRGGTLQWLHVSEYGKISAKYPEKAREIKTGAFGTVHGANTIIVESTAEGNEGAFFDLCQVAEAKNEAKTPLTQLDFKLHFFPWWRKVSYALPLDQAQHVVITPALAKYFEDLRLKHGIRLSIGQKAWYAKMAETLLEDMYREFPSTPNEPFFTGVEGAYYATQLALAREQGRITRLAWDANLPVITMWDLGLDDYMAVWFMQVWGRQLHFIGYKEWQDSSLEECVQEILKLPYTWGKMAVPHDVRTREKVRKLSCESYLEGQGFKLVVAPGTAGVVDDGIGKVRLLFSRMKFDEQECGDGLKRLQNYRKKWNNVLGVWMNEPRHDINSHGADAIRTGALVMDQLEKAGGAAAPASKPSRNRDRGRSRSSRGGRHWGG